MFHCVVHYACGRRKVIKVDSMNAAQKLLLNKDIVRVDVDI